MVRVRAAEEDLKLKEVVVDLLRPGLTATSAQKQTVRKCVQFPLVECAHPAKPDEELTPERVSTILTDGELSNLGIER